MKIICTQENFRKAILNSERIVSKQNTLPILNNILIETDKNSLRVSATNLEVGITNKFGAKIEKEGKITIPAKIIGSFMNNLQAADNIALETIDQSLKIKSGDVRVVIKGLSAEDFPLIPKKSTETQIEITTQEIKEVLEKILVSVAFNESRQELTGVNLNLTEKAIFFASTDSFRLSESKVAFNKTNPNYEALVKKNSNIIIPGGAFIELLRIIANTGSEWVKISIEEGQVFFEIDGVKMISRLINGKYPEYKHIIPKEFKTRCVGEKNKIQSLLKMASVFSSGKTNEINLTTEKDKKIMRIEARSAETGENSSEIKMDIIGPDQMVVLNAKYIIDGLNNINTSQVAILINDGTTPVALKEVDEKNGEIKEDYIYIVMPIKN